MKWQNLLYSVFAVMFVVAGTGWFLQNFELQEVDEFTGFKGEARDNSLFAARLYLKRMGIPAERREGLIDLPDADTVILLNTGRYSLSDTKTDELLAWVKNGGHLITRARVDAENKDQVEEANNNRFGTENRDALQTRLGVTIGRHKMPDDSELPVLFQPANSSETLSVELDFFNTLQTSHEAAEVHYLDNDIWFIDQPYGAGRVSLLTTLDFFENHSLENSDHGKLLWYLLHSHRPDLKQVWLVHQDTLPSLITLLVRNAGALLLMLGLLLVFIFWALIPRFGATIPEPRPERRRILDHVHASGQFLWKRQPTGQQQLCQTMQHSISRIAQQRIPGWQFMASEQQYETLATHLDQPGLSHEKLQHLLSANTLNEQDFTHLVQLARRLRKPQ